MRNHAVRFLAVAGLLAAGLYSVGEERDLVEKSLPAKAGGTLTMNVDRGSILVLTHARDTVEVKLVRELPGYSGEKARNILSSHEVVMQSEEGNVTIKAEGPKNLKSVFTWGFNRMRAEYTVTVPEKYNLNLKTAGGKIEVANLEGDVDCRTAGGALNLREIKGSINAETAGGGIRVETVKGNVKAETAGGSIRAKEIGGDLHAETSGGSIEVENAAGSISAETSGGSIRVTGAHGSILAQTSGGSVSAQLLDSPKGDCTLKTAGGNVELSLPENAAVNLQAQTSGGRVESDFPGELNKARNRLQAKLNGGGPQMTLETSGGTIRVKRN